jgi:hypothetical protein
MAYDAAPSTWIASWSEDGTDVTFPLASVPEMTAAEADATTGDFRKCMFALVEKWYSHYNSLATADKPTRFTLTKSTTPTTVDGESVLLQTYTLRSYNSIISQDVMDEPA